MSESTTLDYKRDAPGNSDGEKREFVADVTSFANTVGGDIIYGIEEEEGVARQIVGIEGDADAIVRRLEAILLSGVDPRLPSVNFGTVPLPSGRFVLVVRIARSWFGPHMATIGGQQRFFARGAAGKYLLNTRQLRDAFVARESLLERAEAFRRQRAALVAVRETPQPLATTSATLLHIIPTDAFETPTHQIDLAAVAAEPTRIPPLGGDGGYNRSWNFDGLLLHDSGWTEDRPATTYAQLFRNGVIETADAQIRNGDQLYADWETNLVRLLPDYIQELERLGAAPPYLVLVSLVGVRGAMIHRAGPAVRAAGRGIDRDALLVPPLLVETSQINAPQLLRPVFDAVYNASGYPRSFAYDADGRYRR